MYNEQYEKVMQAEVSCVMREVRRAKSLFPAQFVNQHEAYAVLLEEVDELWAEIKKNQRHYDIEEQKKEARQVAAMAFRLLVELLQPANKKRRVYIAGKVTGLHYGAIMSKFNTAADEVRAKGGEPVLPLDICGKDDSWEYAMSKCIPEMITCDAVYLLPCGKDSKGAKMEHDIAVALGKDVYYYSLDNY